MKEFSNRPSFWDPFIKRIISQTHSDIQTTESRKTNVKWYSLPRNDKFLPNSSAKTLKTALNLINSPIAVFGLVRCERRVVIRLGQTISSLKRRDMNL